MIEFNLNGRKEKAVEITQDQISELPYDIEFIGRFKCLKGNLISVYKDEESGCYLAKIIYRV